MEKHERDYVIHGCVNESNGRLNLDWYHTIAVRTCSIKRVVAMFIGFAYTENVSLYHIKCESGKIWYWMCCELLKQFGEDPEPLDLDRKIQKLNDLVPENIRTMGSHSWRT